MPSEALKQEKAVIDFLKSIGGFAVLAILFTLLSAGHLGADCPLSSTVTGEHEYDPNWLKVQVSGPDAVTSPGDYRYMATGGKPGYTWSIVGTEGQTQGLHIDNTGFVTLDFEACGGYKVTVKDADGNEASMTARITNAGDWDMAYDSIQLLCGIVDEASIIGNPCPDTFLTVDVGPKGDKWLFVLLAPMEGEGTLGYCPASYCGSFCIEEGIQFECPYLCEQLEELYIPSIMYYHPWRCNPNGS